MKRVNYSVREDQIERLKKHYKDTGTRMSEAVRRGIDLYFKEQGKKSDENPKSI